MNENGKIVTALLAGLAAGAVLGLLFAPDKGSETRDKISDSLSDLGDELKERADEQFGQLNDLKEKIVTALKRKGATIESIIDDEIVEHA
ncbi:YtxH domain-containing protein [Sphingobacterium sp. UT-1RO-CII-1]|uniref:YtxH domain-containing protein n=1 Tax=Sphingobacterium sp. UT-1RO-CII-1 TaxID=2995225 RepID=UPI00227AA081|nr:YtxH domain-containing protein [Sphingobacterium sp. UT-1RO-CII-1]MCY4780855.1 YtxH domain-containing protein [Sphingobacterium sp. UT-1RO-CII-1]